MKYLKDFVIQEVLDFHSSTSLLILKPADGSMPQLQPGQFVNVRIDASKNTFLRRPISICDVDAENNHLYLYVKDAGEGTHALCHAKPSETLNLLLPLGNGFSPLPQGAKAPLLVGGGVGVAPLLYLGRRFAAQGIKPKFLLGGASKADLVLVDKFNELGTTYCTTVDGSLGETGFVTNHSALAHKEFDCIYCCGPLPMMKAVANLARQLNLWCEVSLENKMACGLGACLCCVEDTKSGHKCTCTDGPVFNINELKW